MDAYNATYLPTLYLGKDNQQIITAIQQDTALFAYPAERIYGLGCDATYEQALQQLITLKQRDPTKGLVVIFSQLEQIATEQIVATSQLSHQDLYLLQTTNQHLEYVSPQLHTHKDRDTSSTNNTVNSSTSSKNSNNSDHTVSDYAELSCNPTTITSLLLPTSEITLSHDIYHHVVIQELQQVYQEILALITASIITDQQGYNTSCNSNSYSNIISNGSNSGNNNISSKSSNGSNNNSETVYSNNTTWSRFALWLQQVMGYFQAENQDVAELVTLQQLSNPQQYLAEHSRISIFVRSYQLVTPVISNLYSLLTSQLSTSSIHQILVSELDNYLDQAQQLLVQELATSTSNSNTELDNFGRSLLPLLNFFISNNADFTYLLPKSTHCSPLVSGIFNTVALRCIAKPGLKQLLDLINRPIVSTSANYAGQATTQDVNYLQAEFTQDPLFTSNHAQLYLIQYPDLPHYGFAPYAGDSIIIDLSQQKYAIKRGASRFVDEYHQQQVLARIQALGTDLTNPALATPVQSYLTVLILQHVWAQLYAQATAL